MLRYTKMRPKERRATTPVATAAVSRTVSALAPLNDSTASSMGKRYVETSRSALNDEERFVVVCNGTVLRATNLSPPPERKRCGALYDFISVEATRSRPVDNRREETESVRNQLLAVPGAADGRGDELHLPKGYEEAHFPKDYDKHHLLKDAEKHHLPKDVEKHHLPKDADNHHLPKDAEKHHLPKDAEKHYLPKDAEKHHLLPDTDKRHPIPQDADKRHPIPQDADKRHPIPQDADKRHIPQDSDESFPLSATDKHPISKEHHFQKDSNKRRLPKNCYKLPSPAGLGERHRLEKDSDLLIDPQPTTYRGTDCKLVPQLKVTAKGTRVSKLPANIGGGEAQTRVAGGGFRKETVAGGLQLRDGSRKELSSPPTSLSDETIVPQACDLKESSCDRRRATATAAAAVTTTISVSAVATTTTTTTTTTNLLGEYREPADLETCGVLRRSRRRETLDREPKTCDHPGEREEETTGIDGQKTPVRCWEAGSGQNPFEWRRRETLRGELETASVGISRVRRQEVRREAAVDNEELKAFDRGPESTSCEPSTSPFVSGQNVSIVDAKVREPEFRDLEPVKSLERSAATQDESEDEEPRTDYVSWQSKNEPWSLYLSKTATKLAFCAHQKRKWLHFFDELDSPRERFAYAVRMFQKRSGSRELLLPPRYRDQIAGDDEDDYEYDCQDYGEYGRREDEYEVEEPASPTSTRKPVVERFVAAASTASASSTSFCSAIRKRWTTKIQNNARKLCSNVKSTLTDANSKAPWRAFRGPRTKLTTNSYRIYGTNEPSLANPNDPQLGLWQTVDDLDDYDGGEIEHYRGCRDQKQLDAIRRCSLSASMVDNIVALEENVTTSSMTTMTTTTKRVIQASLV